MSPNTALDLTTYPDALSRSFARSLLEAGDDLRFDLSDQQPASFGSREDAGMARELRAVLRGGDVAVAAQHLEVQARQAFAGRPR